MPKKALSRSPWAFIPTLYFAEGVPNVIINIVSVIFYKNMGISNEQIAWTSFFYLPWIIKMFWAPIVDIYSTKRNWIFYSQLAMSCCLGLIAVSFQLSNFFAISLVVLTIGAFISATYDIATDGFYLLALDQEEQAVFAGIRVFFYRAAVIFGSGFLVILVGKLEASLKVATSWTIAIGFTGLIFIMISIFHRLTLPVVEDSRQLNLNTERTSFRIVFTSYFSQKKIGATIAFILLYRFGEAMLSKISSPFLLDRKEVGGLQLSTSDVGIAYGTLGISSLIIGGILGGVLVSKYGLKKSILPMALAIHLPNLFYVYMAYVQPAKEWVYLLVSLDQFGYGLGFTAFSVYLMYISRGEYQTSHFAISTGLMALGMMFPGLISGYIQQRVGYPIFFVLVFLFTIPGLITLFFIPLDDEKLITN